MSTQNQYNEENHTLIVRYLSGEATEQERQELNEWLEADPANRQAFEEFRKVWESVDAAHERAKTDVDAEWQKLQKRIGEKATAKGRVRPITSARSWLGIAATVVAMAVLAGAIYLFLNQGPKTIIAEEQIRESALPDGSKVMLNRHSQFSYTDSYGEQDRKVLLEGEGFFDVKRDPAKPFLVKAGSVKIEVLGTAFYVNNREGRAIEVVVKRGKVAVTPGWNPSERIVLTKGERGAFSQKEKQAQKSVNKNPNYLSWKTKQFTFENQELQDIVMILNNAYGSSIVISNEEIRDCPVTVSFDQQSLEEIINVLAATLNLDVARQDDEIILSGKGC